MTAQICLTTVQFRRNAGDRLEWGIMFNADQIIVDAFGETVAAPIFSYELAPWLFTLVLRLPEIEEKGRKR